MKDAFVELVRELRGTVRARRQEKLREVELAWSAGELAGFRLFVMGLHSSEMVDVCYALSDAQAVPLLEILGDFAEKDPELMQIAFRSMEKTSSLARTFLANRLIASTKPEVRARTCEMLGNSGAQAEPLLKRALGDRDTRVQRAALDAISRGDFKRLGLNVVPLLRSGDREVRFAALGAVARLGVTSPSLIDDLLALLQDASQNEQTRRLAAGVLARAASGKGRAVLLEALRSPGAEHTLRVAAAESLSGYDDLEAIKAVLRAVDDRDAVVAKTARMSLSRKHSQAFAEILARNLDDADMRVAELAAEMLGGLDARLVRDILMNRLKTERRIPVVSALAQAMSKGGIPGTWDALIAKQHGENICSPAFFHALADVAEEDDLRRFAALFDDVRDAETRRVIMDRLALFARTSPVAPEVETLAVRVLNEPDTTLHIPAATILTHVSGLDAPTRTRVWECLAAAGEDPRVTRAVAEMLRNRGGALADLFLGAPPTAAGLLAQAATEASCPGEGAAQLFRTVAHWARTGAPRAKDALHAMALLAPAALVTAMANCADQIFLLEAWSALPEQERASNRPDLQAFFAEATPADALAGIRILTRLQDLRSLNAMADVAFTSKDPAVRKAALELTRELILAP
ncbi:HEAT repeat domain-containing protein [uncultured Desulfovibrio sp.]|uniref:HEAT repeat domain-containing protein n=4 Tax=uncultured Desulfovibrio sp. TaxID=167968 RepID=UPI0025CCAE40|nr:HEAT repeat domain-containing protein [uncultured Desulfovibrio sp.]